MHDLHNNTQTKRTIDPAAIGTTGTGKTGKIVDRQGWGGVEYYIGVGSITATNAVITATVFEGDVTGTMTSVADADLLGTESAAGVGATATRTSGTSKNTTRRIGYRGTKRYTNIKLSSTVTAGPVISAVAVLHSPSIAPASNP